MTSLPTLKPNKKYNHRQWQARLSLRYKNSKDKTVISHKQHYGPLTVQKPFYPEKEVCHTYLLHPPGGVVGGDQLNIHVDVEPEAHALITTPASGKFYRCDDRHATQIQDLNVAEQGILEWLPQESILFDHAKVHAHTQVTLSADAKFCGWEIFCLGRPASDEQYDHGFYRQVFEISRDSEKIFIERSRLDGSSEILTGAWGMQSFTVLGVMVVTSANTDMLLKAREAKEVKQGIAGVTLIKDLLICRCLGQQGIEVREYFTRVWQQLRPDWIDKKAIEPRIWYT